MFDIEADRIPTAPGVYIFEDADGGVLYVGKAASLRSRVRSYFGSPRGKPDMVRAMMERAASVRFIVTDNEMEAIVLECNLIKEHKPRYNIMLRDDKHYPYIKVTLRTDWPKAAMARAAARDGARYFGPYYPAGTVNETLRLCRQLFPFRNCSDRAFNLASRPCLNYHIGRCLGPCQGKVSKEEYRSMVNEMCLFLEGRQRQVKENLSRRMEERSQAMDFESAARLRDQIQALDRLGVEQKALSTSNWDQDVIGLSRDGGIAVIMVMFIREGRLLGQKPFTLEDTGGISTPELLGIFLRQYYGEKASVPREILLPSGVEGAEALNMWLHQMRQGRVRLAVPKRGDKKRLVEMASKNAGIALEEALLRPSPKKDVEALASVLGISPLPARLECFDISNLQGKQPVGSMVVFTDGEPRKDLYRRFQVRTGNTPDDYSMMREVLTRRLRRGLDDEPGPWAMPGLIVLDGGKGQLGVALGVLEDLKIDLPVAALAKDEEEVYAPGRFEPLDLPRTSGALKLLMRMRDEAHRFALGYHRRIRQGETRRSRLDAVPGVGPRRKRALLKAFGSVKALTQADLEDIAKVSGIGQGLARIIKEHLAN